MQALQKVAAEAADFFEQEHLEAALTGSPEKPVIPEPPRACPGPDGGILLDQHDLPPLPFGVLPAFPDLVVN